MVRQLTPSSSLENLKREAKRWLKALRGNDADARTRFERSHPKAPPQPTLRDVQHALAREYGFAGWTELKSQLEHAADGASTRELVELLSAADRGDADAVREILDGHPEIIDERGTLRGHTGLRTALHFGIQHHDVVKVLLERGANPEIRDEGDDAMPLHFAAERGDLPIVKLLIEHGADPVGVGTGHELNVLGWAICWDYVHNVDVAEYLLAHGATHTIHTAVALGDVDAIRDLAVRTPSDVEKPMDRTNQRRQPLHLAVVKKQTRSLETLVDLGADLEATDARGLTALDQAALNGEEAMARLLIERGAKVNLPTAIALNRTADIERLLAEDPKAFRREGRWASLIVHAAARAPGHVIETLIRSGANVNAGADPEVAVDQTHNYTALHAAAWNGNKDAITVLLRHGANVRARDSKYCGTPVGWANYAGRAEARDLILEGSIDIFDAINHDRLDRVTEILENDPVALNRSFREYADCEPEGADYTPLMFAIGAEKREAAALLRSRGAKETPEDRAQEIAWFLENACPDHHVRGGPDHVMARHTALRILDRYPDIARANIYTAVVSGERAEVERILAERPHAASEKGPGTGFDRSGDGGSGDRFKRKLATKGWEPLLYLCFTRLPIAATSDNALAIARALLDRGADPNAFYMAGGSVYTPLVGVIGEGEEDRPSHPQRDALARLLLERGANPYDIQVVYNIGFHGNVLWFLKLIHEFSVKAGHQADWDDPNWRMLDMGGYGSGARWFFNIAVRNNDLPLTEWMLGHGATPNADPPTDDRMSKNTLVEDALKLGHLELAELLIQHGGKPSVIETDDRSAFRSACFRLDVETMKALLRKHPDYLRSTDAIFAATKRDRADAVALLLDLGMSPDVEDEHRQRPLHIAGYRDAIDVGKLLIERGAEIDPVESNWNNTPFDAAVYSQSPRMIELLGRVSRDVWNLTFTGKVERLRDLFAAEPRLARSAWDNNTPLFWLPDDEAAATEIVDLFVANGADASIKNNDGLTAAHYAERRGLDDAARRLRRATGDGVGGAA